jgi:hypothetical protein
VNVIRDASDRDRSEQTLEINGIHCGLSLVVVVRRSDALLNCLRPSFPAPLVSSGHKLRCQTEVLVGDERLRWASMQRF